MTPAPSGERAALHAFFAHQISELRWECGAEAGRGAGSAADKVPPPSPSVLRAAKAALPELYTQLETMLDTVACEHRTQLRSFLDKSLLRAPATATNMEDLDMRWCFAVA